MARRAADADIENPDALDKPQIDVPVQDSPGESIPDLRSMPEAIKMHAAAIEKLADSIGRQPSNFHLAGIVHPQINPLAQPAGFFPSQQSPAFASPVGAPPINIMWEMSKCIPDPNVDKYTPLNKYVKGDPGAIAAFFMQHVNYWPPFQARQMELGVPDLRSAAIIGHLTSQLAAEAMAMGFPVVPKSW